MLQVVTALLQQVQCVLGSAEVRGRSSSSGTTAVVWGMDPLPTPKITSAPGLVKCQLLISSCGWAGSEAVAWARREIELIWNDNHRLSAFIRPEKVAVLSISQTIARLKVENSKCLGGFHLASPGSWGKPHRRGSPGWFALPLSSLPPPIAFSNHLPCPQDVGPGSYPTGGHPRTGRS